LLDTYRSAIDVGHGQVDAEAIRRADEDNPPAANEDIGCRVARRSSRWKRE
jgi:hypothetical protein